MSKVLCIDITGSKSGGGKTFIYEIFKSLEDLLPEFNKIIIWSDWDVGEEFISNKNIIIKKLPWIFNNRYLIFFWQNFFIDFFLLKNSCNVFFTMNSIYLGFFKPFIVIHQNSLPFTNEAIEYYNNTYFYYKLKVQKFFMMKTYFNSDTTIFLTLKAKDLVFLSKDKCQIKYSIIPLGLSSKFERSPDKNIKLFKKYNNQNDINILYVSSIHYYKNHKSLFKAIEILIKEYPNMKLILIGDKIKYIYEDVFKNLNIRTKNNIKHIEKIEYDKIYKYYHNADFFVFPSSCETLPLGLLEAMKSSVPIVISRYLSDFYITPKNTLLVDPKDPEDLSNKIKILIEDINLRVDNVNKSYILSKQYNWEVTAKKIFNILKKT